MCKLELTYTMLFTAHGGVSAYGLNKTVRKVLESSGEFEITPSMSFVKFRVNSVTVIECAQKILLK